MKNLRLIKRDMSLEAARTELLESECWVDMDNSYLKGGQTGGSRVIRMRGAAKEPGFYGDVLESIDLWAWDELPETRKLLLDFLREVGGELGRVRVSMIEGNGGIVPHIDTGKYFTIHERYHIVIQAAKGTKIVCGDEEVVMHENELWWMDNSIMHHVDNLAESPRIHIVFDIRPSAS